MRSSAQLQLPRAPVTGANAAPSAAARRLGPLLVPVQTQVAGAEASALEKRVAAAVTWAEGPVNQYGGPYVLVHWLAGMTTVGVATAAVHHGVDVVALLSQLPFMSDAGNAGMVSGGASCVAGAACINSLSLRAPHVKAWPADPRRRAAPEQPRARR